MIRIVRTLAAAALVMAGTAAAAAECQKQSFEQAGYVVCRFDLAKDDLRLVWKGADGAPYRTFDAVAGALKEEGKTLAFAMNAGTSA